METFTVGANETESGWFPTFNPNQFDAVVNKMRAEIFAMYSWDYLNPSVYSLLGLNNGPLKDWLTRYLNVARELRDTYDNQSKWPKFFAAYKKKYNVSDKEMNGNVEVYFRVFRKLASTSQVGRDILYPWAYDASGSNSITQSVSSSVGDLLRPFIPIVIGAVAVYALVPVIGSKLMGRK